MAIQQDLARTMHSSTTDQFCVSITLLLTFSLLLNTCYKSTSHKFLKVSETGFNA